MSFIFTCILYIIPIIILTVIYSKKAMTNVVTLISIGLMLISSIIPLIKNTDVFMLWRYYSCFVDFGLLLITNLLADIETDKNNIIKAGVFKQLQLEELMKCDPLTGLYNISSFYNALDAAIKQGLCDLAVIDVDNFKAVNDVWGHDNANEVLIYSRSASIIAVVHRDMYSDMVEEFTIVFQKHLLPMLRL